jgi:hypothetical protein
MMVLTLSQGLQENCPVRARRSAVPSLFDCRDLPKQVWRKETGLRFHLKLEEASSERKKGTTCLQPTGPPLSQYHFPGQ